jgi:hypothetical protein
MALAIYPRLAKAQIRRMLRPIVGREVSVSFFSVLRPADVWNHTVGIADDGAGGGRTEIRESRCEGIDLRGVSAAGM